MRIFVTGATGFVGRALVLRLRRDGHQVVAWVRSRQKAESMLGNEAELISAGDAGRMKEALATCEGVVNLAGESIFGRWTEKKKRAMANSRIQLTRELASAMESLSQRPKVWVSGSAIGYYGDRGDEVLTESSSPGSDFLAQLCVLWEQAALRAEKFGVRVVTLRTGIVLGREGGALSKMLRPFRAGLGATLGKGEQYFSWIHLHDLVSIIATALTDERYRGPLNAVSPDAVPQRIFARQLGAALRRPSALRVPAQAIHAALGEAASSLLGSLRVVPAKLQEHGYPFQFPILGAALADLLSDDVEIEVTDRMPPLARSEGYWAQRKTHYALKAHTELNRPVDEVFSFFSQPANLGLITPPSMAFSMEAKPHRVEAGSEIGYRLRVGPLPLRWKTRIERWEPGKHFVDSQEEGPYHAWWHEHHFRAVGNKTVMEDGVYYAPPLGKPGRLANRLFVASALRRIFGYRTDAIRLRFGTPS